MATTFSWANGDGSGTSYLTMPSTAGNVYASGATFTIAYPASQVKKTDSYMSGNRTYRYTVSDNGGTDYTTAYSNSVGNNVYANISGFNVTKNTSSYFKASNKTIRNVSFPFYFQTLEAHQSGTDSYTWPSSAVTPYTATIILDVPPAVTLGTPTYSNPQYAGLGSYSVPVTSASAYYGGDISKVTLTVGQDSTVQTYSSSSISNQTISVTPTVAGTYTPTLTVEDSRGQTTTETLADITVNPYLNPSLDFDVFRSNSSGVRDDEGAYGLVTANVSFTDAIADLTQPTVKINGTTTNNVTWYSSYSSSTGVSSAISDWTTISSGATIYGLINGSFNQTDSYSITVSLTDSLGGNSAEITQTLSTAFYTIDFQAGGKEIAFGAPANDDITDFNGNDYSTEGLFKCAMGTAFTDMTAQEVQDFVDGLNI